MCQDSTIRYKMLMYVLLVSLVYDLFFYEFDITSRTGPQGFTFAILESKYTKSYIIYGSSTALSLILKSKSSSKRVFEYSTIK